MTLADSTAVAPLLTALRKPVKLVIWDLDETLWSGTLSEGDDCPLRPGLRDVLGALDNLGVLQSIASRNDADLALTKLRDHQIDHYFLKPRINWGPKSASVVEIAALLKLGFDAILFIDDQLFERAEVAYACPGIRTLDADEITSILDVTVIGPQTATTESRQRRLLYTIEERRDFAEASFLGSREGFLADLELKLAVAPAVSEDLIRAEELTLRTNQINSTGVTYDRNELEGFMSSNSRDLLTASLSDRFGDYGTIALLLLERSKACWNIKLILVSCRVMSRGVGALLLNLMAGEALQHGIPLHLEFRDTGRNRGMRLALMTGGFMQIRSDGDTTIFQRSSNVPISIPSYFQLNCRWPWTSVDTNHCPT